MADAAADFSVDVQNNLQENEDQSQESVPPLAVPQTSTPSVASVPPAPPFPVYRYSLFLVLVFVSGMVEVTSYTFLGGIFCGLMTGNLVVLGLQAILAEVSQVAQPLIALGGFMLSSFLAGLLIEYLGKSGWTLFRRIQLLLFFDFILLAASAIAAGFLELSVGDAGSFVTLALMAPAMGFQLTAGTCLSVPYLAIPVATGTINTLFSDNPFKRTNLEKTLRKTSMLVAILIGSLSGTALSHPTHHPFITLAVAAGVIGLCLGSLEVAIFVDRKRHS